MSEFELCNKCGKIGCMCEYDKPEYVCESCGEDAGNHYMSDARCERVGIGVTLCESCAPDIGMLNDVTFESGTWRRGNSIQLVGLEDNGKVTLEPHAMYLQDEIMKLTIRVSRLETALDFFDSLRESVLKIRDRVDKLEQWKVKDEKDLKREIAELEMDGMVRDEYND